MAGSASIEPPWQIAKRLAASASSTTLSPLRLPNKETHTVVRALARAGSVGCRTG